MISPPRMSEHDFLPTMKRIGLIGCHGPAMQDGYLNYIDTLVKCTRGVRHSVPLRAIFLDSAEVERAIAEDDWDNLADQLSAAAAGFPKDSLDAILLCESRLNPVAHRLVRGTKPIVVSIARAMEFKLKCDWLKNVALLGFEAPKEESMWADALKGYTWLEPDPEKKAWLRERLRDVQTGIVPKREWADETKRIVASLHRDGADAIIYVSYGMRRLLPPNLAPLDVVDACEIHAFKTAEWMLGLSFGSAGPCALFSQAPLEARR